METRKPQHSTGPACCCYSPSRPPGPVASAQPPHDRGELPHAGARCRPGDLHKCRWSKRPETASKTHWAWWNLPQNHHFSEKKKWWPRRFDVSTASSGSTSAPASTSSWMQATLPCRAATCKAVLPARTTRGSRGDRRICSNSWWHVAKIRYLWVPFVTMGTYHLWHLLRGKPWEVLHQFLASWSDFFGGKWELHGNPQKNGVWVPPTPSVGRVEVANQSLGKRNIHRVTPLLLLRPGKVMNTRVQQQMMANRMPIRTVYFSQLEILRQNLVSVLRYEIYHSPTSKWTKCHQKTIGSPWIMANLHYLCLNESHSDSRWSYHEVSKKSESWAYLAEKIPIHLTWPVRVCKQHLGNKSHTFRDCLSLISMGKMTTNQTRSFFLLFPEIFTQTQILRLILFAGSKEFLVFSSICRRIR